MNPAILEKGKRIPLIAGNWKMNFNSSEARQFAQKFKKLVANVKDVEILICAPFTCLETLHSVLAGSNVMLGAQNIFYEESGTFTGEISAKMISPYCSHVIVGHSERRKLFQESNKDVNKKIKRALKHGLTPIVCIGESFGERKAKKTKQVLKKQLSDCLKGLSKTQAQKTILAYEPIWAKSKGRHDIAKSKAAPAETAQQAHEFLRGLVSRLFGKPVSEKVRILYGGSMKPTNVKQLLAQEDIDGGLVGGSSLSPESFSKVVKFACD